MDKYALAAGLILLSTGIAAADCTNHFAIDDPNGGAFCATVAQYNAEGLAPLLRRRPGCPKGGSNSKCNPSSITVPDDGSLGLIVLREQGMSLTLIDPTTFDGLLEDLSQVTDDRSDGVDGTNWRILPRDTQDWNAEQTVIDVNDRLRRSFPFMVDTMRQGSSVFLVSPEG